MPFESIRQLPIGLAYLTLFGIVMLRANATYWAGRLLVAGGRKAPRIERFFNGPAMTRAKRFSDRWGVFAVPLCFLTVGIQTAVNLSAGALRMPLKRYLPAVVVGCLMWALIYVTVGLAAIQTILLAAARSPWALVALVVLIGVIVGIRVFQRRLIARRTPEVEAAEAVEPIESTER